MKTTNVCVITRSTERVVKNVSFLFITIDKATLFVVCSLKIYIFP